MENIIRLIKHFKEDSLYRNSIYLILSTAIMSFFGYFFWIINARLYTTEQIGLATTLITVSTLISTIGILGFNQSIVKYMPTSNNKKALFNTILIIVVPFTILLSVIYIINLNFFSDKLIPILNTKLLIFLFIIFNLVNILNILIETYFIAVKNTIYVLIKNSLISVIKLFLPFVLIAYGSFGVFSSYSLATFIGLIIIIVILLKKWGLKFSTSINFNLVRKMTSFTLANYFAGLIGVLPTLIMPSIITKHLSPNITAYFYVDMMIINLLLIIPSATSQSLFAEGVNNITMVKNYLTKSIKIIILFLLPAILITFFFGEFILLSFGKEFSTEGVTFLRIMSISVIFGAINYLCWTLLKIQGKNFLIIATTVIKTILIITTSYYFINYGLIGIGYAWIFSELLTSIFYLFHILKK